MKTIIAGSRGITDYELIVRVMNNIWWKPTEILCGGARGVDRLGKKWGIEHSLPVYDYPADWSVYGIRAGYVRNLEMAKDADALVAIWDGVSKGTNNMIKIATNKSLLVYVYMYNGSNTI
jgi:hypothetical protein